MNTKTRDKSRSVNIWPPKPHAKGDVNDLSNPRESNLSSRAEEIRKEAQAANKQKRLDDTAVATLVKKSNRILVSISSHAMPFDFFPDVINVEEGRLTIIKRHFLASEVHSVDIKDISNVFIYRTFFFSQLVIISKTFESNEVRIRNLNTTEAVYVRRIIEGLRLFANKQIDTSNYTEEELLAKLEELSTTEIVT